MVVWFTSDSFSGLPGLSVLFVIIWLLISTGFGVCLFWLFACFDVLVYCFGCFICACFWLLFICRYLWLCWVLLWVIGLVVVGLYCYLLFTFDYLLWFVYTMFIVFWLRCLVLVAWLFCCCLYVFDVLLLWWLFVLSWMIVCFDYAVVCGFDWLCWCQLAVCFCGLVVLVVWFWCCFCLLFLWMSALTGYFALGLRGVCLLGLCV